MGRPKLYADPAAKQRAHRERLKTETVTINRDAIEPLMKELTELHNAINEAATRNNPIALKCRAASISTTLHKLTVHFNSVAAREKAQ